MVVVISASDIVLEIIYYLVERININLSCKSSIYNFSYTLCVPVEVMPKLKSTQHTHTTV